NSNAMNIMASFVDYPSKVFTTSCIVKPQITMKNEMKVVVNFGNNAVIENLDIDTAPQAKVQFTWESKDPGSHAVPDAATNKIIFPFPNGANGKFALIATVMGDNGKGDDAKCTIGIYETIYLVGVSKTMDRRNDGQGKITYVNEVVAKWLAHPRSLFFKVEEPVSNLLPFVYNGVTYYNDHTGVDEEVTYTFEKGSSYYYPFGLGSFTYNGSNAPSKYLQYFGLSPEKDKYNTGPNGEFLYVFSRYFGGGLVDSNVSWKQIFEYIYP
ncbi:MAG: hypothetical protein RR555_11295, partial [Bacteroidales bacterium]